jgi:hypothetical protein
LAYEWHSKSWEMMKKFGYIEVAATAIAGFPVLVYVLRAYDVKKIFL